MSYRLGVDVGGTFTDLALYDTETNRLEFAKTPSTPANQAVGVAAGIRELMDRYDVSSDEIEFFIHGTTVATNTLLERKGSKTALIVTEGFRDILQIGRQDRPSLYDWRIRRSDPLVPRHLRFEVRERMIHTGEVLTPIDHANLASVIQQVKDAGVEAIAVCLLHSYANPAHEQAIGEAIRQELPDVPLSLSHQILPEFKEYERMSTTTINAYVAPVMEKYLTRLKDSIAEVGVSSDLYIMQSNGGTMGADTAIERPVHTILSGPAAGVIGAVAIAQQAGQPNSISVDMGGTSFDVSLSYEGEVRRTQESEIERLPVKVPMVDIHTLGAGGGSIAWIDPGGALRVGPQSAGADPGPACYGNGGTEAAVTDANLVLGRLGATSLLGGTMTLDVDLARDAIKKRIADPLGLSVEAAAEGIIQVVNASMVKGIRVVSVSKGYDPREFCLVAFGGAGPVHVSELAAEMDIPTVLVPIAPGVTSALGLLMADLRHDFAQTVLKPGHELSPAAITAWYQRLESEAMAQMSREGVEPERVMLTRTADARYVGQGYELEVPAASETFTQQDLDDVMDKFHDAHVRSYGYASRDNAVEIVNLRVTALANMPRPDLGGASSDAEGDASRAVVAERNVYFRNEALKTNIYDRSKLQPGDSIDGPAIVEQLDSTTVVWADQTATVDGYLNLLLTRK
jgi:N-methylhydantoinase A